MGEDKGERIRGWKALDTWARVGYVRARSRTIARPVCVRRDVSAGAPGENISPETRGASRG